MLTDDRWSNEVIGACVQVHRAPGVGFKEVTYGNALAIELEHREIPSSREVPVELRYRDRPIGKGFMDVVIDDDLVLELKTDRALHAGHESQLLLYLSAADRSTGLLINFHSSRLTDGVKRVLR